MNPEELYIEHKREAKAAARWAAHKFHRPFPEARDHAEFALALVLLQHLDDWDEDLLPLNRWIQMRIRFHLIQVFTRGRHPYVEDVQETAPRERSGTETFRKWDRGEVPAPSSAMSSPSRFQRMIQEVGEEGAALFRILRELPSDLWEEIRPKRGRTREKKEDNFRTWLIDTQDWTHEEVERAIEELMECL